MQITINVENAHARIVNSNGETVLNYSISDYHLSADVDKIMALLPQLMEAMENAQAEGKGD